MLTIAPFQSTAWDVGILATDISTVALEKAIRGVYQENNITHLPPALKNKYFQKSPSGEYSVDESLRKMILHRRLNLMRKTLPFKGTFQVIFCRNVMIYFDQKTRDELVGKFAAAMDPGGYLFIGHSETLGRNNQLFRYLMPATYQRAEIL